MEIVTEEVAFYRFLPLITLEMGFHWRLKPGGRDGNRIFDVSVSIRLWKPFNLVVQQIQEVKNDRYFIEERGLCYHGRS